MRTRDPDTEGKGMHPRFSGRRELLELPMLSACTRSSNENSYSASNVLRLRTCLSALFPSTGVTHRYIIAVAGVKTSPSLHGWALRLGAVNRSSTYSWDIFRAYHRPTRPRQMIVQH